MIVEVESLPADPLPDLTSGALDMAISGLEHDPSRAHLTFLFDEEQACLMRPGHELAKGGGPLNLADYLRFPHVSVRVGDAPLDLPDLRLAGQALTRQVIARVPFFHAAPAMIGDTDALLTIPRRAALRLAGDYGLALRPAPELLGRFQYHLLRHERLRRDPAAAWLEAELARACA